MNIINISSKDGITQFQLSLFKDMMCNEKYDIYPHSPYSHFTKGRLMRIVEDTPIYLVDSYSIIEGLEKESEDNIVDEKYDDNVIKEFADFPMAKEKQGDKNKIDERDDVNIDDESIVETTKIDLLGYYCRDINPLHNRKQSVYICIDKINELYPDTEENLLVVTIVLVHEFAHRILDFWNDSKYPRNQYYKWMEESLANVITINVFLAYFYTGKVRNRKVLNAKTLRKIIRFIKGQPPEYRLALDYFDYNRILSNRNRLRSFGDLDIRYPHFYDVYRLIRCWIEIKRVGKSDYATSARWLNYVKNNVGKTNYKTLLSLTEEALSESPKCY